MTLIFLIAIILLSSCSNTDWKNDFYEIQTELDEIKTELANQKKIIEALQQNATIENIEHYDTHYSIQFSNGQEIILTNGKTPLINIGNDGFWYINEKNTSIKAIGVDGHTPNIKIGENYNWYIDGKDTGVKAKGENGHDGKYITNILDDKNEVIFYFNDNSSIKVKKQQITKELKVLCLGNSFTEDAFNYVPWILSSIVPELKLSFGLCVKGGGTLKNYYNALNNNSNDFLSYFTKWTTSKNNWEYCDINGNVEKAITEEDWDLIILQQYSWHSDNYSTYQPYLNDLIKSIYNRVKKTVKIGFLITPSNKSDYNESCINFQNILEAVEKAINNSLIEFVIPCGTALQNARTTHLRDIGQNGNLTNNEHLQEGIACQIESYAAVQFFLNYMNFQYKSIYGDKTIIDENWYKDKLITGRNGAPLGSSSENCRIAQICAIMSLKHPFGITDCNGF